MVNCSYQVQPVFYDVKPNVVKNQTGSYAEAFTKHESLKKTEVHIWKEALTKAANLSGWDLQDMENGYESKFIDKISNDILQKLCDGALYVGENLVGVDARVNKMNLLRFVESTKVHMIGICGIGGIGKTTHAKVIYNMMHVHFDACSFCEDVQGVVKLRGLIEVQKQLIVDVIKSRDLRIWSVGQGIKVIKCMGGSRRLLIVLDNIDHPDQLEALAGSRSWFVPGSLIVFTSRDKQKLNGHQVDEIFHIDFLDEDEALKLFSLYAFKKEHPIEGFEELADQVVQSMKGHPLGLKVLGCFLYRKTASEWKSEIGRLQVYPNADIQRVLRSSFDSLERDQQQIFLDIACSFNGESKDLALAVLNSCGYFADTNLRVLVDKSLISISSTLSLQVHDLLQRMAWEIIRDESKKPGERSRLWIQEEVRDVLNKDMVTDAVEVLVLLLDKRSEKTHICSKAFARMGNLRILKICYLGSEFVGRRLASKVEFSGCNDSLSNELRLFYWHGRPFKFLPSSFYPKNIVAIDMSYSYIKSLWTTPMEFKNLKLMNLRHCCDLANTPDFTEIKNLQELNLEGCRKLVHVHPSVWTLKKLIILNLRNCRSLANFPHNIETESLQILNLSGCLKVDKLPDAIGTINTLLELYINGTAIKQIPSFILGMTNLQILSVAGCGGTQSSMWTSIFRPSLMKRRDVPQLVFPSCSGLRSLKHLDASHCTISEIGPDSISGLSCLEYLNLSGNNFVSLPANFCQFPRLATLGLVGCENLEVLPELPPSMAKLDVVNCTSLRKVEKQPAFTYHSGLLAVDFTNCPRLAEIDDHTVEGLLSMMLPQQSRLNLWKSLHILVQGNRIPRWFTNQSSGKSIMIKLPRCDKFIRLAACLSFRSKNIYITKDTYVMCNVKTLDGETLKVAYIYSGTPFTDDTERIPGSDLLWLLYSKFTPSSKDANTIVNIQFNSTDDVEVKECGVRLTCDEEEEEEETAGSSMIIKDEPPTKKNRTL